MMKILLKLIFILFPILTFGQYSYDTGLIITINNDTINCLVPLDVSYGNKILIKIDNGTIEKEMNSSDIKYLVTKYNVFESISYTVKKKEKNKLMRFIIEGNINLYSYTIINTGNSYSAAGGTTTMYTAPTIEYVIKKDKKTYYLKKRKFNETIIPIIKGATELINKIENKEYQYNDIEKIINEYNKFHKE